MKMVIIDGKCVYSRRHEHGPGVHRRRPALRRVARHLVPAQRPRRRALPHAVRVHLAAQRPRGRPGDRATCAEPSAHGAGRGHAGAGAALERLDRVQDHPRRVHHRAHQRARAHLDPVAVLRARRAADHGDVRRGPGRRRRALHDDRRARQEDPLLRGPRLLPAAAARRREGLPVQGRVPARQDGDGGRPVLASSAPATGTSAASSCTTRSSRSSTTRGVARRLRGAVREATSGTAARSRSSDLESLQPRSAEFRNSVYRLFSRLL